MKKIIMTLTVIMLMFSNVLAPPPEKENQLNNIIFSRATEKTALAIRYIESREYYYAKGLSGEIGAYQFMPQTWNFLSKKYYTIIKDIISSYSLIPYIKDTVIIDIDNPMYQDLIAKLRIQEWIYFRRNCRNMELRKC